MDVKNTKGNSKRGPEKVSRDDRSGQESKNSGSRKGGQGKDKDYSKEKGGAPGGEVQGFDKETGAINRQTIVFGEKQNKKGEVEKKRGYGYTEAEDDHPFLKPQITIVSGSTGSGKTVAALNILDEALAHVHPDRLGKVMVYTGSPSDPAMQELDNEIIDLYGPDQVQSLIDDLHSLQLEVRGVPEEKRKLTFLILDDAGSNKTLSPTQIKGSEIGEILVSHRHLGLHVVLMAQRIKGMMSPFVLANFSHLFMYPMKNKVDEDELLRNIPFPADLIQKHISTIRSQKFGFLWIDVPHKSVKVGWKDVVLS